ncbi:MAG: aromatic ring-hydroxylating dioxygenase subunit alpha [Alphaproteobacteria bacterium]|nr:aromatic ring-hydroxylating dioxygenase subunit alpha [Alphaproteobacteria bacterium]
MFKDFEDLWTPAAFSTDLGRTPLPVTVAGEALVLFRDADGAVSGLVDRCPHRGVALSLGEVTPEGCLRCPFHGWAFDGAGRCTDVPMNPDARRDLLGAQAVHVEEAGGLIWLWTGAAAPDDDPPVPELLARDDLPRRTLERVWSCHWTRAMENMLDVPHLPFVHGRSIGRDMAKQLPAGPLRLDMEPQGEGFKLRWRLGEAASDGAWVAWTPPNGMMLNLMDGPRVYRQHMWCVPGRPGETRMMLVTVRQMGWLLNALGRLSGIFEDRILLEDQHIVESHHPAEVPPPAQERSVATDRPTLRFRQWYWGRRGAKRAG